jgi:GntR family transcriptional regulator
MHFSQTDATPLFEQVARQVADLIVTGSVREGERVPSTTMISSTYRINPATVLKGMNLLVDRGYLVKKRGLGLFVAPGAKDRLRQDLINDQLEETMQRLVRQARTVGIVEEDLIARLRETYREGASEQVHEGKAENDGQQQHTRRS